MERPEVELTFEEALERLREIIAQLEDGKLPLEQALDLYQEGVKLAAYCRKLLENCQQKIELMRRGEDGTVVYEEFTLTVSHNGK